jgi:hypothetical protein
MFRRVLSPETVVCRGLSARKIQFSACGAEGPVTTEANHEHTRAVADAIRGNVTLEVGY